MKKFMSAAAAISVSLALFACSHKQEAPKADGNPAAMAKTAGTPVVRASFNHDDPNVVKVCISGAHCEECYKAIKSGISGLDGVRNLDVDRANKSVFVQVANKSPRMRKNIEAAVVKAGFNVDDAPKAAKKTECRMGMSEAKDCPDGGQCKTDGKTEDRKDTPDMK